MTESEYKEAVIEFFKSGRAQEAEWRAMAEVLHEWGDGPTGNDLDVIHLAMFGQPRTCPECGSINPIPGLCWGCELDLQDNWDGKR